MGVIENKTGIEVREVAKVTVETGYGFELCYRLYSRPCTNCQLTATEEYDLVMEKYKADKTDTAPIESARLVSVSTDYLRAKHIFDMAAFLSVTPMCAYEFAEEYFAAMM